MNEEFWQFRAAAANYYDASRQRTRVINRLKAHERRGHVEPALDQQLDAAEVQKKAMEKVLTDMYKRLAPPAILKFQKETAGIGESLTAQLIGYVGDFRTYTEAWWEDAPEGSDEKRVLRTGGKVTIGVRDVWAYAGMGDPARRRRRGGSQEEQFEAGSPNVKRVAYLMADFALRQNGKPDKNGKARAQTPYYPLYLAAKAKAEAAHEDWTPLHRHNHALRLVAKAILKDLWRVQHGLEPAYGARTPWERRDTRRHSRATR
jgi:hypothetical protein